MKLIVQTIIVAMGLLSRSVPALILRAAAILEAMTLNKATFPSPIPALAQLKADIDALTAAETGLKNRTGTLATREANRAVLIADLHQLHAYVQQLASANPAQAANIAHDAAMLLKKTGARHKNDLATKQQTSGSVHVVAKAVQGGRSYEWQYSTDGKTWINVAPTGQAHALITGLQPGVVHYFRQRAVTKAGPTEWSHAITALVS